MTLHFLTGIVDDGGRRSSVMPRDTATALQVAVGDSTEIQVRVYYASGVAVPIASLSGWTAQLDVSCTVDPCQRLPDYKFAGVLAAPDVLGNKLVFTVPTDTFRGKAPGRYFFDVWLITPTARWQIVGVGAWHLQAGLARP